MRGTRLKQSIAESPLAWVVGLGATLGGLFLLGRSASAQQQQAFIAAGKAKPTDFTAGLYTPTATTEELASATTYTVQKGDSLSEIAASVWSDQDAPEQLWLLLWSANRDTISDPNLIYPGEEITVPAIANFSDAEISLARHYYLDWQTYSKL